MAGNKALFETEMQAGNNAAFDERWLVAIEHYMKAVREFPGSPLACNSLGLALFHEGRLEDALKVYIQASKLDPDDPLPVEKTADVYERMGRLNDAAKQYITVAEIYLAQQDLVKAIDNWEHATRITPGLVKIHQKLALAYERTGQRAEAVNEYLRLAFHFQNSGNGRVAEQALQRAMRLDSKDPRVLNAYTAVRNNQAIAPELLEMPEALAKKQTMEFSLFDPNIGDADERGPMGEAVEDALEELATAVFATEMDMGSIHAIQAIELHRAGILDEAVGAYQRAEEGGMKTAPLFFNLGVLLYQTGKYEPALRFLTQVKAAPTLMAGAYHAISLSYIGMARWSQAAKALVQTLRLIDLSLAMGENEAGELNSFYTRVNELIEQTNPQTLETFCQSMAHMLTGKDWKRRIAETRSRLEDMIAEDPDSALETIAKGEKVIDAMGMVDEFVKKRRFRLALDETEYILQQAPDYLAAHLRIAQVLMDMAKVGPAIAKYNLIARTYLLRGDQNKAAEILNEVIQIAPADVNLRSNLIELLEQQNRWLDVIDQYVSLADAYRQLGDMTNSRLTYDLAMKVARQHEAPALKLAEIHYHQAMLDMERLDIRGALRSFQKVLEVNPQDENTRRQMVTAYYRLGDALKGLEELDRLLQIYARQKRTDLILGVLEEQQQSFPDDMGLLTRLAAVYQQLNRIPQAVALYDRLAELQLDAGMNAEAAKTIRKIISFNPPKVAEYQTLLQQIGG